MRHRKAGRKLGMDNSARKAMFRNMVTSLLLHGRIRTTEARAKELRRYAERMITIGKGAPSQGAIDQLDGDALQRARADRVHAYRRAAVWVNDKDALRRLFEEYAERFRTRPGGYTRVVKAGRREGDNARMAVIELVEALEAASSEAPVDVDDVGEVEEEVDAEVAQTLAEAAEEEDAATEVSAPEREEAPDK